MRQVYQLLLFTLNIHAYKWKTNIKKEKINSIPGKVLGWKLEWAQKREVISFHFMSCLSWKSRFVTKPLFKLTTVSFFHFSTEAK